MRMTSLLLIPWVVLVMPGLPAAGEARGKRAPDYAVEVKSILGKHCYACHGAVKQKANLRLDTVASIHRGGDSGPAVVSGKSGESLIVEAVSGQSGWRMPPESEGSPLSSAEIAALTAWIDQGAVAPADDQPQADPRAHWAFRTPRRPEVPTADALGPRAAWVRNPIDAFLAVEHRQRGLTPRPAADPATLIRRVHLDLTGLLPGPDLVRAFEADPSNEAYEAIVDRLLASPQYGERWARHWMDVWRYSDWDGWVNEVRESQPHIWRWRDWIVESLNRDAPYSEMIVAMLAADEAWPGDDDALRATGFLVRNWYKFNRNVWLENTVEHTSKAFLGITINCAKCHDHKYDPITQGEYYAFRAFFEPHSVRTDQVPGQPDTAKAGLVRVFDSEPAAPTYRFERGDDKKPLKDQPIAPGVPRILQLQAELGAIKPVALPPETFYPGLRPFVREEAIAQSQREVLTKRAELIRAERAFAEARGVSAALEAGQALALAKRALRAAEAGQNALEARIAADTARYAAVPRPDAAALGRAAARLERKRDLLQAEEAVLKAEIANALATTTVRKAPHDLDAVKLEAAARTKLATVRKSADIARKAIFEDGADYAPLTPVYAATSTGRRLALARWITDPRNPLAARMAINQIWMRHLGTPLVATVFDFGRNGAQPVLPALLDWLAVQLRDGGWRMKPIHRLIVTSALYRMESTSDGPSDQNRARDPLNTYYWRMNPKRMEAEAVRDNVLQVAGNLDCTMGGPDLDPEAGLKTPRRSLYFRHAKEKRVMFLRLFDSANVNSCYRRSESVVPQQALALANSSLCLEQARLVARSLTNDTERTAAHHRSNGHGPDAAFVRAAFERVLGRSPTSQEQAACADYLIAQARRLSNRSRLTPFTAGRASSVLPATDPAERAREDLVHVLLNHNDFVTIR
ncbi:MAG: DUF1553 domain-containing protein [Isosphaeraceae bacterium]